MSFVIRRARAGDEAVQIGFCQALNQYEEPIAHDRRTDRTAAAAYFATLKAQVAEHDGAMLIAEADGQSVGHLIFYFQTLAVYVREEKRRVGHIAELFVCDSMRGRGIGQALMHEAEQITRAADVNRLTLGVMWGNDLALKAYHRFGFKNYALEMIKPLDNA